jgi:hypothetical protein
MKLDLDGENWGSWPLLGIDDFSSGIDEFTRGYQFALEEGMT